MEGFDWQRIAAKHPGGLRDMTSGTNQFAVQHQPGTYTDDSQMAFALAKSLVGGWRPMQVQAMHAGNSSEGAQVNLQAWLQSQHACLPHGKGPSPLLAEPLVRAYSSKMSAVLSLGC